MANENLLNERSKNDFLVYANSVIKSRAIPYAEDNLKPIHRKILYTLYEDKVYADKKTKKCATEVGSAMKYSPHGDASAYGALVRLGQWWKLRYPLVYIQGNAGNVLGDGPAASRYTECRLSEIGMLMLEDLDKNCINWKPNYDGTLQEPVTLPSKFPYLLCGNNEGIAVGMGSNLVSHNFTEVADAINYYMAHPDCKIIDLMQYIKGPDFPTGGIITNGDELLNIYSTGRGNVKMTAHYDISKQGKETLITFHDLPYGVNVEDGVKAPLKKLILEDGYEAFQNIYTLKKDDMGRVDIVVVLSKDANIQECLNLLMTKTRLAETVKINQTLIINGEPRILNLKQMIEYWVNYRSGIIRKIAQTDYDKTNHKLTITLGLQKCMSDIDLLVQIVRNAPSRIAALQSLMKTFELNEEQANAVLDMKLSRLNRLDIKELNQTRSDLEEQLAKLNKIITDEQERYKVIRADLAEIKKVVGEDKRLTEIVYRRPLEEVSNNSATAPIVIRKEWKIFDDGVHSSTNSIADLGSCLKDIVFAYSTDDIFVYDKEQFAPVNNYSGVIIRGATVHDSSKDKLVAVTKNGNIKVSLVSDYKLKKADKVMKLKENDSLVFVGFVDDNDFIVLYDGAEHILKLAVKDLPVAGRLTLGVKTGFTNIVAAMAVNNQDYLLMVTDDRKGKLTAVQDFGVDSRGNKGQLVLEKTKWIKPFVNGRDTIYGILKGGKVLSISRDKVSIKSKTATGALITNRVLEDII